MKLVPLEPFSKAAPGFNKEAAQKVYKAITECPDDESAQMMLRCIVFDVMNRDIARHEEILAKHYNEFIVKRANDLKAALTRQYVAKRVSGEDIAEIAKAAEYLGQISKDQYDPYERSRNAMRQRRGASGQFVREHSNVPYDSKMPVDEKIFNRLYGVQMPKVHGPNSTHAGKHLNAQQQRNWQLAYQHAMDVVGPYADLPGAKVHFQYPNHEQVVPVSEMHHAIGTLQRPRSVAVSVDDNFSTGNAPNFYQMFSAAGAPATGARIQGTVATNQQWDRSGLNPDRLRRYADARDQPLDQPYALQPGGRLFNRLAAGSQLLSDSLGDNAPRSVKAALSAGQWVGEYGPEAQRVLGPTAQKTAYRYRGVERKPDERLTRAVNNTAREMPNASLADRLKALVGVRTDERGDEHSSPVVQYFKTRLPEANYNTLHTKSGNVPPSEGVVFDKHGKIVTQAVGYGDDWYLPFNLKNVNRMRGGSYVRTRTFGGPTTEDVYTALMSGAESLTVVSHNGVWTVNFDKSFKGGRRYNDKAARMVSRYGQILDAVKSGEVTLDLMDPARKTELSAQAARNVRNPDDPQEVNAEFRRLVQAERMHPKLSQERTNELQEQVVQEAASKFKTKSGEEYGVDAYRSKLVLDAIRANGLNPEDPAMQEGARKLFDQMSNQRIIDNDPKLAERYQKLTTAELAKTRRELSPLSLNGQGYNIALQALREQFPYYIHEPEFHAWKDGSSSKDSGYIKPRHLRPEEALAGYYDPDVNGHGKIKAHSLIHAKPQEARVRAEVKTDATRPVTAPGVSSSAATPAGAQSNAFAAAAADRELAMHLSELGRTGTFADSAPGELPGKKIADVGFMTNANHKDSTDRSRKIAAVMGLTPERIEDEIARDPDGFHKKIIDAVDEAESSKLFSLPQDLVRAARRRGGVEPSRDVPRDVSAMVLAPNEEYRLGPRFEPNRSHTRESLMQTYADDSDISAAKLPAPDSPEFNEAASRLMGDLRSQYAMYGRDVAGRYGPQDRADTDRKVMGLIKAKHIKTRLGEVPADEPVDTHEERIAIMTPEDAQRFNVGGNIAGALFHDRPAIENAPASSDPLAQYREHERER